jgi:hypothetical protein
MSWLSTLAKIAGVAAAPFTGGASLIPTVLSGVGDVASVLGKQQQGKAQGQVQQANAAADHDRNATSLYGTQQAAQNNAGQLDLQRQQFETGNRSASAKQALIGALLGGGMAPTSISGGQRSGGIFEALQKNPDALGAMKTLGSQGSAAQLKPQTFTGGELLKAPQLSAMPEVDNGGFLSTLANIGQLIAAPSMAQRSIKAKPTVYAEDEERN